MSNIKIVKIGGNVIDDESKLMRFLQEFASIDSPKILVHGGGKLATRMAERLEGVAQRFAAHGEAVLKQHFRLALSEGVALDGIG